MEVNVTGDTLTSDLADGRTLSVPLTWYPRLWHGMPEEDISIEGLLLGKRSGESQPSLQRWLDARAKSNTSK